MTNIMLTQKNLGLIYILEKKDADNNQKSNN